MKENSFKAFIPMELEKSESTGEWKIRGLASTKSRDLQGEVLDQEGLDLTPILKKRGVFNFDHKQGVENVVGLIDGAKKTDQGLVVEGRLFKNHDKAKAIYQIMSSLNKSDRGRMGMSVEGVVKERAGQDGKLIKKAVIKAVALTMNPVNPDTYVDLVKSTGCSEVEFDQDYPLELSKDLKKSLSEVFSKTETTFTADQVASLIKAMGVGAEYATSTPAQLEGGAALAQEDLDKKKKKKPEDEDKPQISLKKADSAFYKSTMKEILDRISEIYPEYPRQTLWEIFKDRLSKKFE